MVRGHSIIVKTANYDIYKISEDCQLQYFVISEDTSRDTSRDCEL